MAVYNFKRSNTICICTFTALALCILFTIVAGHGHDHGHSHDEPSEQPSFKYSQQANKAAENDGHVHDHDHGHGHAHDHGHGGDHGHAHKHGKEETKRSAPKKVVRETGMMLWGQALGATFLISISPVFILMFIPLDNTSEHKPFLKVLLSFASGGLLGDAFLHLIPHAVSPHSHGGDDHSHSHDHGHSHGDEGHSHVHDMTVGMWVLGGIVAFLIVEKVVRCIKGDSHSHSHAAPAKKTADSKNSKTKDSVATKEDSKTKEDGKTKKDVAKPEEKEEDIKVAGYLNLAADFAHNFTDGLAIGASFLVGRNLGIITTITIFLHEIPHEIGDFAILVQSGCSKKKAMMLQFSTALGAMLGTVCSLLAEGGGDAAIAWVLPFTAGGFIYIATVSVIPELLEDTKLVQSIKEIFALFVGIFMMVLIGLYE